MKENENYMTKKMTKMFEEEIKQIAVVKTKDRQRYVKILDKALRHQEVSK